MTAGVRVAVKSMTGSDFGSCPWSVFHDPFVARVIDATAHADNGNLAAAYPNASHRLIDGVTHYTRVRERMQHEQRELEAKKPKRYA